MNPDVEKFAAILSRHPVEDQVQMMMSLFDQLSENFRSHLRDNKASPEVSQQINDEITHIYRYHLFWLEEILQGFKGARPELEVEFSKPSGRWERKK